MIQQLKLSSNVVFLEGMSLKGAFTVANPNQTVAISYQIDTIGQDISSPEYEPTSSQKLSIFPKNGLLLKGQSQKITIRAKNHQELKGQSWIESGISIRLKCTLNNNFNKILIKNKKIADLSEEKLISYEKLLTVHIEIGTDHLRLKNEIENQVLLGSSLGKQTANISMIGSNVKQVNEDCEDCEEVCTIVNNLQLNSKLKSRASKQQSLLSQNKQEQQRQKFKGKENTQTGTFKKSENKQNEHLDIQFQSADSLAFSKSFADFQVSAKPTPPETKVNSLQVILLAILAGFFYSLGSNIRQLQG